MIGNSPTVPSLHSVYQDYFKIGAAVNSVTIDSQKSLLAKHFNSITAENEMKFELLHPTEHQYTFERADEIAAFAKQNGMKMRGHTLVWHNQTPDWVFTNEAGAPASRELLLQRMEHHITTVMERYKEQIYSWDVVNEAISDDASEFLRPSKWLDIIGEDFIAKAFEVAHKVDPNVSLFYNDYNESHPEKREKIYRLVKSLVEKEIPIHGVGLQAHWNLSRPTLEEIRAAIERYASLGLQIQITEMDVSVYDWEDRRTDLTQPTEEMKERQEQLYEQIFQLFREYRDVISSVTFWGVADDYTWLDDFPVRGRKNWPFVFNEQHHAKGSFWKIVNFNQK
ncbi:endo-1,4-beta-xylanase [Halalkalibacter urbisdiaboli]|uniref:endo-1,4-beta-xylanase n=1 Tax=Halalkalibacter urbisdiaboli TaxID=1960589 RepID=UPI000B44E3E9|nr:endo-1,4-beta-xylanase [Halalkalibacter urbisdiaboli]